MTTATENFQIQKKLTGVVVFLFLIKLIAWYYTDSVAILTDALEYTINVISGFIGLYSLHLSAQPSDKNHPYGHGKVEFVSASIEGTLMLVSSFFIGYEALKNLQNPHQLKQLDYGILLMALTAGVNYAFGFFSVQKGKKNNSLALIATGRHLQSDTYATIGIIIGLVLIHFTQLIWIDSLIAFVFMAIIAFSGYKILRTSIAGIMDEADDALLSEVVALLQKSRGENWVDLHNLRIIKYGGTLHLDCHLTVPWFFNINEGHDEVDKLSEIVRENFSNTVEFFVHTDGCLDFSCQICCKKNCPARKFDFVKSIEWTVTNISLNTKHAI
jgi:cation diffusion facilitator family transporter